MTKITNMYYDVFTNETVQRVDRWWWPTKSRRTEGLLENLETPAEEILRACKNGEWEIIKQETKSETLYLLKEKSSNTLFNSFFFYSIYSLGGFRFSLSLNGYKAEDMFTYFEGASIAYALHQIRKKIWKQEEEKNKQEIIKDFEVWK